MECAWCHCVSPMAEGMMAFGDILATPYPVATSISARAACTYSGVFGECVVTSIERHCEFLASTNK
jgi:hypothetical protein